MKLDLGVGGRGERKRRVCVSVGGIQCKLFTSLFRGEQKKKHLMPGRYAAFVNQSGKNKKNTITWLKGLICSLFTCKKIYFCILHIPAKSSIHKLKLFLVSIAVIELTFCPRKTSTKIFFGLLCPMFRNPSPPELLLTPFLC